MRTEGKKYPEAAVNPNPLSLLATKKKEEKKKTTRGSALINSRIHVLCSREQFRRRKSSLRNSTSLQLQRETLTPFREDDVFSRCNFAPRGKKLFHRRIFFFLT
ncbi:hypothetical protein PUN28_019847 [Cardiocondyla obscurior]|uniref:Uncharacterized protein n=1 Tax=Cardiocondyla obscurior TaxID=286306 RepID=A0AAW2EDK4_9HYME